MLRLGYKRHNNKISIYELNTELLVSLGYSVLLINEYIEKYCLFFTQDMLI